MGSAYFSLEDDFSSGFYNPGAFKLNAARNERKFRVFLNPIAMVTAFKDFSDYDMDYKVDNKLGADEALLSALMLLKGVVFTTPVVDFGVGFGEEVVDAKQNDPLSSRFFTVEGLTKSSFHSAFVNVKIAPTVSVGMSGTLYAAREENKNKYDSGYTFGVLLAPNPKLNVGIAYNKIPEKFSFARLAIEDIESDTATGGISYYPDDRTVLTIDLRNLNKEDLASSREIHTGIERIFGERIALRGGYYRKKVSEKDVFSVGFGILPLWGKILKTNNSTRSDIFSYTLVIENSGVKKRWHVLSLFYRY